MKAKRMMSVKIYALTDVEGSVFYVGQTFGPVEDRLRSHVCQARRNARFCERKTAKIVSLEYRVNVLVLDVVMVKNRKEALKEELKWIQHYLNTGVQLVNREAVKKVA